MELNQFPQCLHTSTAEAKVVCWEDVEVVLFLQHSPLPWMRRSTEPHPESCSLRLAWNPGSENDPARGVASGICSR